MVSGSIEVESKFVAGPGTEAELVALGATLAGDSSFSDRYFDTPDLRLTLADHWLRLRQGAGWELKCPPEPAGGTGGSGHGPGATTRAPPAEGDGGSGHVLEATSQEPPEEGARASGHILEATSQATPAEGTGASGHVPEATSLAPPAEGAGASGHVPEATSQVPPAEDAGASSQVPEATSRAPPAVATTYQELTSPGAIVGRLCGVLGVAPGPGWDQLPVAMAGLGLEPFATFVTRRRSYRLGGGLRVDLDKTDFGYAVAEVEALARAPEDVPAALEGVMRLRRALGLDGAAGVPGKMSVYLQRWRPAHYQALLRAGVLAGSPHGTAPELPEEHGPPGARGARQPEMGPSGPLAPGHGSCTDGTPSAAGTGLRRR
ncbi:thiamine-triphosphatase [Emydura macquarii macquarii]|uniref:thiamine-triphosphatase n=1 Tax=Emydura macquarii macquarii TaxID=1129001 RepID=UPI00352B3457